MPSVRVNNNSCYYAISKRAPEHGPVVVCLHGSGADGIVWSYQLSRLSSRYRVIVPDLPGHGRSEGQPLDSPDAYAVWLEDFCRALNLASFFIMGHSFGGAIAQEYARRHPNKIRGLVLVGTGMRFVLSRTYREFCEQAACQLQISLPYLRRCLSHLRRAMNCCWVRAAQLYMQTCSQQHGLIAHHGLNRSECQPWSSGEAGMRSPRASFPKS